MATVTRAAINDFLSGKRIAVIGASRNPKEYSRLLYRELLKHGYEAIPVNPGIEELDGRVCFKNVKDINPAPERAVIILPRDKTERAVLDCAEAGVNDIWLHRHTAGGVSDTQAVALASQRGMRLITGYCMFMFLPGSSTIHRFHGGILNLLGMYPK